MIGKSERVYVRGIGSRGTRYKSVCEDKACDGSGGPGCVASVR